MSKYIIHMWLQLVRDRTSLVRKATERMGLKVTVSALIPWTLVVAVC